MSSECFKMPRDISFTLSTDWTEFILPSWTSSNAIKYSSATISNTKPNNFILLRKSITPKHIYFSKSAGTTVVLWEDGTKTVVKCTDKDNFCEDQGFAMALAKKIFGNRNSYMKYVENGVDQDKEKQKKNKKKPLEESDNKEQQ